MGRRQKITVPCTIRKLSSYGVYEGVGRVWTEKRRGRYGKLYLPIDCHYVCSHMRCYTRSGPQIQRIFKYPGAPLYQFDADEFHGRFNYVERAPSSMLPVERAPLSSTNPALVSPYVSKNCDFLRIQTCIHQIKSSSVRDKRKWMLFST